MPRSETFSCFCGSFAALQHLRFNIARLQSRDFPSLGIIGLGPIGFSEAFAEQPACAIPLFPYGLEANGAGINHGRRSNRFLHTRLQLKINQRGPTGTSQRRPF
ncbi:hypothetical protein Poly41_60660 [Novipirellula artificiosorum]|uniref:Uncharacterized protein n=1 Tax=Novipirellula artificiosorum TaxID=2528016 RepID=A0A5C6D3W6_9BACT|nr:hypothetical protein Poly41_60660 [Novipirellula artificiosorum]